MTDGVAPHPSRPLRSRGSPSSHTDDQKSSRLGARGEDGGRGRRDGGTEGEKDEEGVGRDGRMRERGSSMEMRGREEDLLVLRRMRAAAVYWSGGSRRVRFRSSGGGSFRVAP